MGFREKWTEYQLDAYCKTDYKSFSLQPAVRIDIDDLAREYKMEVNPYNRKDRLKLALKLDEKGDWDSRWKAIEIMSGRRCSEHDGITKIMLEGHMENNFSSVEFYGGFR